MPRIFKTLEKIRPLYDWTYKILMFICKLLLIADIVITTWAVLGRYVPFITDPHWSEEIVLTFMVYMAVLSATLAIRKRAHIRMTSFDNKLPKRVIQVMDLLADLAVLALGVVLLIYGIKSVNSPLSMRGHYASLPNLSKMWQYLPVPIAGLGMILFELEQVFLRIEDFFIKDDKNKEVTGA
ncbi:MAG: TRAP transporter small permease [Clostridia bacterium]|nr:TRAP transporter small permease [Clostridia bacterium]